MKNSIKKLSVLLLILFIFNIFSACNKPESNENNSLILNDSEISSEVDVSESNSSFQNEENVSDKCHVSQSPEPYISEEPSFFQSPLPSSETSVIENQDDSSKEQDLISNIESQTPKEEIVDYVFVSIYGFNREVFLNEFKIEYFENMTAFDAILKSTEINNISLTYRSNKKNAYIEEINGLSEFDYGGSSGWIYIINQNTQNGNVGVGRRILQKNDKLCFYYVSSLNEKI